MKENSIFFYLKENIKDFYQHPSEWFFTLRTFFQTLQMPYNQRLQVLQEAESHSREILSKERLDFPFKVQLDRKIDPILRTASIYSRNSAMMGLIDIKIKSYILGNDVNLITSHIIHEYAHAIYEEALFEFESIDEWRRLLHALVNSKEDEPIGPDLYGQISSRKETFCDLIVRYLMNRERLDQETVLVCVSIIQKFNRRMHRMFQY